MAEISGPSVRGRRLAAELRRLREERSLTGEEVADALGWSASKLSRIELGRTGIKASDLSGLLEQYEVAPDFQAELLALTARPRSKGWWDAYTDSLPVMFATYINLESEAESISAWSTELMPGLLQTKNYARAAIEGHERVYRPVSPGEIERKVLTRLRRQRILTSEPTTPLVSVLDESVLLRRIQSAQIMRDQLAHLIEMSDRENVTLHVLPLDGEHPVGTGAFMLLQFAPLPGLGPSSDIVYVEQLAGSSVYFDDDAETHPYRLGFERLVAESLDPASSRDRIAQVRQERWSD
jgi:transcriptional regulator with XRE-family HTH domain